MKICHMTSPHKRYDIRIFIKECRSLAKAGYDVSLIVADGKKDEKVNNISIYSVSEVKNKWLRALINPFKILKKSLDLNADLYHFHDPELIIVGLILLLYRRKKVIYDIHEDFPRQHLVQKYKLKIKRKILEFLLEKFENFGAKKFTTLITATPYTTNRFKKINQKVVNVNNYVILNKLSKKKSNHKKENEICYVGDITKIRIVQIVKSLEFVDIKLNLFGYSEPLEKEIMNLKGWGNVINHGYSDWKKVTEIMNRCIAGMAVVLPYPNLMTTLLNKFFEYMSCSLPIIISNFDTWKRFFEKYDCAIFVDPENPLKVAQAIQFLKDNPERAIEMGKNGRKAVETIFNWSFEEKKLLNLYQSILS